MQFNTDFHMHYLNASEESRLHSLTQIQIPDFISQESTYLRVVGCLCVNIYAFTPFCLSLTVLCIVFTRLLLKATNQTLLRKKSIFTRAFV